MKTFPYCTSSVFHLGSRNANIWLSSTWTWKTSVQYRLFYTRWLVRILHLPVDTHFTQQSKRERYSRATASWANSNGNDLKNHRSITAPAEMQLRWWKCRFVERAKKHILRGRGLVSAKKWPILWPHCYRFLFLMLQGEASTGWWYGTSI